MFYVGPHVSIQGGAANAPVYARKIGATGFGMFVKNQRQWIAADLTDAECDAFKAAMAENGYTPAQVLPHAGYLINLANPDPDAHQRSLDSFVAELKRCHALGLTMLNIHPGSHLQKISPDAALIRIADSINTALDQTHGVKIVVENTAGQGGYLGKSLEELAAITSRVNDQTRIGVCLDTCHAFTAGYDLRQPAQVTAFLDDTQRLLGKHMLAGLHLNDTIGDLGSHKDRHAPLGHGTLGWATFQTIMRDPRCANIPVILETPEEDRWPDEIRQLLDYTETP